MLSFRYAVGSDAPFIMQTQGQQEVAAYVGSANEGEIAASLVDPDQAYLIALDDDRVPVGFAYLRQLRRPERSIELFRLAIADRNKGLGAAFLNLIMAEAFGPLNANRLWLDVFPENARARHVYQRLGFVEEGTLRDVYFQNGVFRSTIIMSILAREYQLRTAGC
jgi:RimJ/RimL family protein N-acetyltransferase